MPQHQIASGTCDRTMNPADGVGSLKHGPRTHPTTRKVAWCITVPPGTGQMEIPVRGLSSGGCPEAAGDRIALFRGLSVEETAGVLHVSTDTVKRDWSMAKLWLLHELKGDTR